MLNLSGLFAFQLLKGQFFFAFREVKVDSAVHADVEEGLELHLGQAAQYDLLLDLLSLKDIIDLAQLHKQVPNKEPHRTLFSHLCPFLGLIQFLKRGSSRRRAETRMAKVVLHLNMLTVSLFGGVDHVHILGGRLDAHARLLISWRCVGVPWLEDQTGHVRVNFGVFGRGSLMVFMHRAHTMTEVLLKVRSIDAFLALAELLGWLGGETVAVFAGGQAGGLHDCPQRFIVLERLRVARRLILLV